MTFTEFKIKQVRDALESRRFDNTVNLDTDDVELLLEVIATQRVEIEGLKKETRPSLDELLKKHDSTRQVYGRE